jgi:hypothetical protein
MAFNLRNRNFLKELDFTPDELKFLLKLSADLKAAKYGGFEQQTLKGKNVALIFEKPPPARAVPLKWRLSTRVLRSPTWGQPAHKSGIKNR